MVDKKTKAPIIKAAQCECKVCGHLWYPKKPGATRCPNCKGVSIKVKYVTRQTIAKCNSIGIITKNGIKTKAVSCRLSGHRK